MIKHLKSVGKKFREMIKKGKQLRPDSKFLIITFFLCFVSVTIYSISHTVSSHDNMIIIRTLFSALFGYIVENFTRDGDEPLPTKIIQKGQELEKREVDHQEVSYEQEDIGIEAYQQEGIKGDIKETIKTEYHIEERDREEYTLKEPMLEIRVLIIGHVVMFIVALLIIGSFFSIDQTNPSLILLKNTAFAGVGFLISASHTKEKK